MASKEKLKRQIDNATLGLFSGMQEAVEPKQEVKQDPKQEAVKKQKKMVSFRMDEDQVNQWKAYAEATGQKTEVISSKAFMEYMERHKLTADQQTIFDLKLKLLEARK